MAQTWIIFIINILYRQSELVIGTSLMHWKHYLTCLCPLVCSGGKNRSYGRLFSSEPDTSFLSNFYLPDFQVCGQPADHTMCLHVNKQVHSLVATATAGEMYSTICVQWTGDHLGLGLT